MYDASPLQKHTAPRFQNKLDAIDTPSERVLPLLNRLGNPVKSFEAGAGNLVGHLVRHGHACALQSDVAPRDAYWLEADQRLQRGDQIHSVSLDTGRTDLGRGFDMANVVQDALPVGQDQSCAHCAIPASRERPSPDWAGRFGGRVGP